MVDLTTDRGSMAEIAKTHIVWLRHRNVRERAKALAKYMEDQGINSAELERRVTHEMRKRHYPVNAGSLQAQLSQVLTANPKRVGGLYVDFIEVTTGMSLRLQSDDRPPGYIKHDITAAINVQSTVVDNGSKKGNISALVRLYTSINGAEGGSIVLGISEFVREWIPEQNQNFPDSVYGVTLSRKVADTMGRYPIGTVAWVNRLQVPTAGHDFVLLEAENPPNYRIVCFLVGSTDTHWIVRVDNKRQKFTKSQFPIAGRVSYFVPPYLGENARL